MKLVWKFGCILILGLTTPPAMCGELLGRISDETATVTDPAPHTAAENKRRIIYRVICPAGGEVLPECEQPPVDDVLDLVSVPREGPTVAETVKVADAPEKQSAAANKHLTKSRAHKSVKHKKSAADKKHAKISAKKAAKKSQKPLKRKHR